MTDKISEMRSAGFSEDEIQDWLKSTSSEMTAAGFSQEEIVTYFTGAKPPNDEAMRRTFEQLLSAASVDKDGKPKPLTFQEALEAGWGMSVGVPGIYGLAGEGKLPEKQLTGEEPWYTSLGYGAAQMVGDIPASVVGAAVLGAGGTAASGPGGIATASAGAFAMPALLRSTMVDAYTKGEFKSFPDFVERASGIFFDTAKAYTVGLVAPAVGGEVGGRVGGAIGEKVLKTTSPMASKVGYTTGEVATMVAASRALEGEVPKAQDFADAALLLLGAKVAVRTAQTGKTVLMDVWKKTGIPPWKVVADAKSDPTIAQDIAMGKEIPRAYESQVDPIFKTPAAKPETPASKPDLPKESPYVETRGGNERFHGTSKPIDQIARGDMLYDSRNIYGQGFYTTDAVDVSIGYTKKDKGGQPTLYRVVEQNNPRFYDMEIPMPDNVREIAERALGVLYNTEDVYGKPIDNLRALYDEARAESKYEGYTRDDVQGMFDDILVQLQGLGYDGFLHVGGSRTKTPAHAVKIYWTPEKHVRLEQVDFDAYKKPETPAPKNITSDTETPPDAASSPSATRPPPVTPGEIRTQRDALFKIADNLGVKVTQEDGRYYARMDKPEINVPSGAGGLPPEYGLTPDFVFAHELGHAIVIRFGAIFSNKRDDSGRFSFWSTKKLRREISNWDEFTDASKEVRPEFWNNPALRQQDYVRTPDELVADTIAAVLTGKRDISILYPMMKTLGMKPESFGLDPGGWRLGGGGGGKGGGGDDGFPAPASGAPEPGSLREAQDTILSKVDLGGKDPFRAYTFDEIYTAILDDFRPIEKSIEQMKAKIPDGKVETRENPYILARLTRGLYGKAQQALEFATFDFATLKDNGKSLKDVLAPVKDDLNGLRAYAIASRALELKDRFIVSGFNIDAAAKVVAESKAKFEPVMRELVEFQNRVTKQLVDSGIVSKETYTKMLQLNKQFVPFYRVFEDAVNQASGGKGSLLPRDPIKGIKGSGLDVVDPLESIIKNTYTYIALADRNAVVKSYHDLAVKTGTPDAFFEKQPPDMRATTVTDKEMQTFLKNNGIEQMPKEALTVFRALRQPLGKNEIAFFEDGKRVVLKLEPELAAAFKATDRQTVGMLVEFLAAPARLLRAGSTLSPDFIVRNFVRDQVSSFVNSKVGYIPIYDTLRGAASIFKKDETFQAWLKSGGANSTLVSLDRNYIQSEIFRLIGEKPETNFMDKAWNVAKTPVEFLRIASELVENSTRVGEFKRTLEKAGQTPDTATTGKMLEGGINSREVILDFQRIGTQTKAWNLITAFFNAQLQGLDKTVRSIKDNPLGAMAKIGVSITLPSVLLWYANHDDPRWKELKDWERDLFWIIMTDDHIYRIPKPFELGILFGSLPERMLDAIAGQLSKEDVNEFSKTVLGTVMPPIVPTAAQPIFEQVTNFDFMSGHDLVPSYLEDAKTGVLPEYRYTEYTSELSKTLGSIVGQVPWVGATSTASPIVIENYVRDWTGGLGAYALQAADYGLRKTGILPDPVLPASTLSDIPIVKAFAVRYPSASAESIQNFREEYVKRVQAYNTVKSQAKQGDFEASMRVMQLNPQALVRLDGIDRMLSESNQLIRLVYKNPAMTPDEKRQLIDVIYYNMIQNARMGNDLMKEVDSQLLKQPK